MHNLSMCKHSRRKFLFPPVVFLAISIFFLPKISPAQNTGAIEGKVIDAKTSHPVAGANVLIDGTDYGAASDSTGAFRIDAIPAGRHTLKVLVIGYENFEQQIEVKSREGIFVSIRLTSTILEGPEISIERQRMQDARLSISPPTYEIDPRMVEARAGAFEDVLRFVQTMPGVITPNDFSNQFIVRGGGPNQNLIILDGVELFSPYRRNGMASVFNPAIVQDVKLYAGGFPAIFGDRLSSVLSMTSRDGTTGKWLGGRVGTSLTNANLLLEGKTNFWNGSWLVSGRRSYYDLFSRDFVRDL
ncbi:MAG: carboxypeptidase-like regulatory domain-containing protein, partial [bacterium]